MASNAQRLRTQSLFDGYDQLTPGAGGSPPPQYNDDPFMNPPQPTGLDAVANQQASNETILDPTGQPLQQAPVVEPTRPTSQLPPLNETIDAINRGYTPEFRSRDRFDAHLDTMPEREEPSWGRKLVAGGIGLGSKNPIEDMDRVMQAPYLREQTDWVAKNDPYYKSAELENRANINERTLVTNAVTSDAANRRSEIQQRNNEAKNEASLIRANAYAAKQKGAIVKIEEGMVVATYADGRPPEYLGRVPGTSTDAELANIKGGWGVKQAEASGAAALDRTIAAGNQLYTSSEGVGTINPRTGKPEYTPVPGAPSNITRPGTAKEAPPLKAKELQEQKQAEWSEIYDQAPADERRWMKRSADGKNIILKDPPTMGSWLQTDASDKKDIEAYNRIKAKLYPSGGIGGSNAPPPPETKKPVIGGSSKPPVAAKPAVGERADMPGTPKNAWVQNIKGTNKFRRSMDGGKTWQISTDGGKTWGK